MKFLKTYFIVLLVLGVLVSCGQTRRVASFQERKVSASISLPDSKIDETSFRQFKVDKIVEQDTMTVNVGGQQMLIMKATMDKDGALVASQELQAAVVTARFRNVAERHGKIDLEFQVKVPQELADSRWQLRFYPDMFILGDSTRLDNIIITGANYRKSQLKGYQLYERWLRRIVTDSTRFIDVRNLEIWLERNCPDIYAYKRDTTYVEEEIFESCFGVSEKEAISHYTDKFAKRLNENRKKLRGRMYKKYIKAPIVTENVRLDTVMQAMDGDFIYNYVQTINTRKGLKKVDITLSGDIYEQDKLVYDIPTTEPLTFYISSLSAFTDPTPRYVQRVIERQAEANAAWNIDFKVGKSNIEENLGDNKAQIGNIKDNLRNLLANEVFDLDSITIAAFASPEGSIAANKKLTEERAKSSVRFFNSFVKHVQDSVRREAGMSIVVADEDHISGMKSNYSTKNIKFKTSASGENWDLLTTLVNGDEKLSDHDKEAYNNALAIRELDMRENALRNHPMFYKKMKEEYYPLLRTVQFNFFLHRKGMIKDTIHTTELDTTYMKGIRMLADRDYEGAIALLGPYQDYNTAIAYVSLDRNVSAMKILENLERTPQVNYMLAVLHSREGDERKAVECYLTACKQDGSFVHRGNLDPEIAALIKKYNLNAQPEDDFVLPF